MRNSTSYASAHESRIILRKQNEEKLRLQEVLEGLNLDIGKGTENIIEIEKWISLLTLLQQKPNPELIAHIQQNLSLIDQLKHQNFTLRKQIIMEKKKYVDMKEELKKLKYLIEDRNAEMVMLDIEDMDDSIIQLESTVDSLSEEVEMMTRKNEEVLLELKENTHYQKYGKLKDELRELSKAHEILKQLKEGSKLGQIRREDNGHNSLFSCISKSEEGTGSVLLFTNQTNEDYTNKEYETKAFLNSSKVTDHKI